MDDVVLDQPCTTVYHWHGYPVYHGGGWGGGIGSALICLILNMVRLELLCY